MKKVAEVMMRKTCAIFCLIAAILISGCLTAPTYTDMTFVQEYTGIAGGAEGEPYLVTTSYSPTKMKMVNSREGETVIIDLEKQERIVLKLKTKEYDVEPIREWADLQLRVPFGFGQFETKITTTADTEIINHRKCTKIVIQMGGITRTSWVSTDVKPSNAVIRFNKKYGELFKDVPIIAAEKIAWEKYEKMNAFPVKIVDNLKPPFACTLTMELKSHNYNKIDPSAFEIPEGYTSVPKLKPPPKALKAKAEQKLGEKKKVSEETKFKFPKSE